ncbi:hypothetical protein [Armatimonas rosea]|uniref:Fibronectin type-III domain-containing protein n=1 Tax=Armatimonas rosea TaxID=685828 RepID=A0A7W9SNV4_ARMRO|nr:hypothetical protein [Armatimonas rosea]MBB6049584.1 hypothetical protein [Armatimonas rosea]
MDLQLKTLAPVFALTLASGAWAQNQLELMAARTVVKERPQVRLLWMVTQGWLPEGGVNLYRSDQPTKPLNESPIKLDAKFNLDAKLAPGTRSGAANKLFGQAIARTSTETTLSSKEAFADFKQKLQDVQSEPGVRGSQMAAKAAAQAPKVIAYRKRLAPPKAPADLKGGVPLTVEEQINSARIQVLLSALTSYEAAQKFGLAFIDKTARAGVAYTYTLRAVDKQGKELPGDIATVQVPASGSLTPPAPAELNGVQLSQTSIALHWEPLTATEEEALVGATYAVYREGKKLNETPLRIAFQPTVDTTGKLDGKHIAPMVSFIDSTVPLPQTVGATNLNYSVILTDAFGRESTPAKLAVSLEDLRTPGPVTNVIAVPSRTTPGALRVVWAPPSDDTGDAPLSPLSFDLYRTESNQPEVALTTPTTRIGNTPISTSLLQAPELKDITLRDFLKVMPQWEAMLTTSVDLSSLGNLGGGIIPAIFSKDELTALRDQPLTEVLRRLTDLQTSTTDTVRANAAKNFLTVHAQDPNALRFFLDTTGVPDKNYSYRVAACYTTNPSHHGTPAQSAVTALPSTAAPAAPAAGWSLSATFAKGAGSFGYLQDGTSPTLRTSGRVGAETMTSVLAAKQAKRAGAGKPGGFVAGNDAKAKFGPSGTKLFKPTTTKAIAGKVTVKWQPAVFTSPTTYRVYRAVATGLFPTAPIASAGQVPQPKAPLNPKLGMPQKPGFKDIVQQRLAPVKYFENYPSVPRQNYVLLGETTKTEFTDTLGVSQRTHYHYRVVPVSRWGVEGPETPVTDVLVPATLPPSTPTLLSAVVDELQDDGRVRLAISPGPANENITRYAVFAKAVDAAARVVQREQSRTHVASTQNLPIRQAPTLSQSRLRNLSMKDLKANGGALLRTLLDPQGYVKIGEVAASANREQPLTFVDTKTPPRVPMAYRVVAINEDQIGSQPSNVLDGTALKVRCESPRSFTSVLAHDSTTGTPQAELHWQAPASEVPASYVLERATQKLTDTAAPNFIKLPSPTGLQLLDGDVRSGRKYTYRLRAVDSEGLFSEPLTATVVVPALAAASFGDPAPSTTPAPPPPVAPVKPNPVEPTGELLPRSKSAQFGKWYRYDTDNRWAFSILTAEYTTAAFVWGPKDDTRLFYPTPQEKFIKLTLAVKNIGKDSYEFGYQSLIGHGVSADGNNGPDFQNFKRTDNGNQSQQLLPAGKTTTVEAIVTVSATGAAKAIHVGETVFPLGEGNTVASLPPFLSKDGVTVAAEVPAQRGQAYPGARFEAAFVGITRSSAMFGDQALEDGKEFVIVTLALKNKAIEESKAEYQTFTLTLYDTDDDKYTADKPYKETKPEPVTAPLAPTGTDGDSRLVRYLFTVPKGASFKRMTLREGDARTYVYPQGELK